jgi:hypothetical protein
MSRSGDFYGERGGRTHSTGESRWHCYGAPRAPIQNDAALIELSATTTPIHESAAVLLADRLLRGVGARLAHSAMVVRQVERVCGFLEPPWRSAIVDAAWLHDVGYSRQIAHTGFHPLDAARWLRERDWPMQTCRLVAWHTAAQVEAALRGLEHDLVREFDPPPTLAAAALTWADLTSSPHGEPCTVDDRLNDILRRYPPESIIHRAIAEASPTLWEAATEIASRLALPTGHA